MILKTLHWYMLRELLRIFLLTASALTTMLAFGGTFKPLTKEGLEIAQLMWIMLNLMPAMLAYTIPMAALFAAVLVYWRLSTDNEIMACRAGGVSFWAILIPALLLGLVVASADLVFVNYVVPVFLQRAEAATQRDLGSLLVYKVGRQETFQYEKMVVYADHGEQHPVARADLPPGIEQRTYVDLWGVAAASLGSDDRPQQIVAAPVARVTIDRPSALNEIQIRLSLTDAAAFDPHTYRKLSGSFDLFPPADHPPFIVPSFVRAKPSFLDWRQLQTFSGHPEDWGPIREILKGIERTWRCQQVAERYRSAFRPGEPVRFDLPGDEQAVLTAPVATLDAEKQLNFAAAGAEPVRVRTFRKGRPNLLYTCEHAALTLTEEDYGSDRMQSSLKLTGKVMQEDLVHGTPPAAGETVTIVQPLLVPPALVAGIGAFPVEDLQSKPATFTPSIQDKFSTMHDRITGLFHQIESELHSRGSFALSCLTLVLLGAALGIMMRGRNPLLVFVVGFVPAIILVLLITAGRRMVENGSGHETAGLWVIWTGNIFLLLLVMGVYARLVRR